MIKAFIIDDEPKIRKALRTMLRTMEREVDVVGEAENAVEGLKRVEQAKPDLLFLDVIMPGMDGFEMLMHMEDRTCQIVIVSGYNDFNYAKKAISHNVVDYVLKPFDPSDIRSVVDKAAERIRQRDAVSRMELAINWKEKENSMRRQQSIKQKLYAGKSLVLQEQLDLPHYLEHEEWTICVFALRNYYSELMQKYRSDEELVSYIAVKYIEEILESNGVPRIVGTSAKKTHLLFWAAVPSYTLSDARLQEIRSALRARLKMDAIVIRHPAHVRREEMAEAIQRIENNVIHVEMTAFGACGVFVLTEDLLVANADDMFTEINRFTQHLRFFVAHGLHDRAGELLKERLAEWSGCRLVTIHFLYMLRAAIAGAFPLAADEDEGTDPLLFGAKVQLSADAAFAYLLRLLKRGLNAVPAPEPQDRAETIRQYIELHYAEPLSLAELARKFYVSKEYLAVSFKKKCGSTVHQYIQKVRLDKSKALLERGEEKISSIALAVGYDNFSYFNKLFRRQFGVTPSEYRERAGGSGH